MMNIRIKTGIGFDVHAFAVGRKLILGGVHIPFERGLDGHSDADVLTHAVMDALSGICLGKDIGALFPDTDAAFKNADSLKLLSAVQANIAQEGYDVHHIDAVIIAQEPKMAPHIPLMRQRISSSIGLAWQDVTIKATTTEYLGFTGRKEGIAALAVATVSRRSRGEGEGR